MINDTINSDSTDGYDPVAAFEKRRTILLSVQEVQAKEHDAFQRIAVASRKLKEEFLVILSEWLLRQYSPTQETVAIARLIDFEMAEWFTLQSQVNDIETRVAVATRESDLANGEYKRAAPMQSVGLGFLNKLTADETKKSQIELLSRATRQKSDALSAVQLELSRNTAKRQAVGKEFLRKCLDNIVFFDQCHFLGVRAQNVVFEINACVMNEWNPHQISKCTKDLQTIYRTGGQ